MSDRMGMAEKNLEHIIYNSVDYNFENDNQGVQETSPYLIVREVSAHDTGITGADSTEISGDSQWAYKTIDITTKTKKYTVTATLPGKVTANDQNVYTLTEGGNLYCNASMAFTKEGEESVLYLAGYGCKLTSSEDKKYGGLSLLDTTTGSVLQEVEININGNKTYFVKIVQKGSRLDIYLNGVVVCAMENFSPQNTQVYGKTGDNCTVKLVRSIT